VSMKNVGFGEWVAIAAGLYFAISVVLMVIAIVRAPSEEDLYGKPEEEG